MPPTQLVTVFGAAGHTGQFVVAELRRRGLTPVLAGRDRARLEAAAEPESDLRVASVNGPAALDRTLAGAAAVINCAGPFGATAGPIIEAALRNRIHYLDVTAEQAVAAAAFADYRQRAHDAGIVIAPALGFYGGVGDLVATAAMAGWPDADEIRIGIALSYWHPTGGTRRTVAA